MEKINTDCKQRTLKKIGQFFQDTLAVSSSSKTYEEQEGTAGCELPRLRLQERS